MRVETIKAVCDALHAEPFHVVGELSALERMRMLDNFVMVQYVGAVTTMGAFFLPSDAQAFALETARTNDTWTVVLVRKLAGDADEHLVTRVTPAGEYIRVDGPW